MDMMWFDDNAKKPVERKIDEAVAAYMRHFGTRLNVALVNAADRADLPGIRVRVASYVQRNTFRVGWEDEAGSNTATHAAATRDR